MSLPIERKQTRYHEHSNTSVKTMCGVGVKRDGEKLEERHANTAENDGHINKAFQGRYFCTKHTF